MPSNRPGRRLRSVTNLVPAVHFLSGNRGIKDKQPSDLFCAHLDERLELRDELHRVDHADALSHCLPSPSRRLCQRHRPAAFEKIESGSCSRGCNRRTCSGKMLPRWNGRWAAGGLCFIALAQVTFPVEANFRTPWVTSATTPRVAELLTDTSMRGSPLVRDSQCDLAEGLGQNPCVLPINANMSLLSRAAGELTGVDVTMDVYPGPSCTYSDSAVSYLQAFSCQACNPGDAEPCFSDSDVPYHYPLRSALFRSETDATVIRVIFPKGFDASQVCRKVRV